MLPEISATSSAKIPRVSVLIANYNGIGIIETCINSILQQDFPLPLEIIVHDDASSDDSVSYIRHNFPQVTLIVSERNVGFCIANNRMASIARGDYLLLLNNDASLLPGALSALANEAAALSLPAILTLPQYDADTGQLIDVGSWLDPFLNVVPNYRIASQSVGVAIGACLWLQKSLWDQLGGFPDWFGSIGEDLYLCCLARLWGFSVHAVGTSGFKHQVGSSLGGGKIRNGKVSTNRRRRALSERNKCYVMLLTMPTPLLIAIFPLQQLLLIAEGLILSLLKHDSALWTTIYAPIIPTLWQQRAIIMRCRRAIQQKRRISLLQWLAVFTVMPYKLKMLIKHGLPQIG